VRPPGSRGGSHRRWHWSRTRVSLTVGNRPDYRGNWPGLIAVPAGYQPVGLKFFEFEFKKLKNVAKSLKIHRDLLSLMVLILFANFVHLV
jgi:hypothetical protein